MRPFDTAYIWQSLCFLIPYVGITLTVTLISVICGSLLGALLAYGRMSHSAAARAVSAVYVHIIRCTPSIVLLFVVFYGLPAIVQSLTGVRNGYNGKMLYVVIALTMLSGASFCELMRSAYQSVDRGQSEAAFCCGLSRGQTARLIIIPQAAAAALPNFCTEVIILLKQGSLAFTIGFTDLMGEAQIIVGRAYGAHGLETYIALAGIYWLLTIIIERIADLAEHRFSRGLNIVGPEDDTWN
jgi:L-cystine transport system permease protein